MLQMLRDKRVLFWDFDGVIKDSIEIKSLAFEKLFLSYGEDVAARVRRHHEENGGMSRFEKIPLYLGWANERITQGIVDEFCSRFSQEVEQAVIDSAWVPGVREYLLANGPSQYFVLVTATPEEEIRRILSVLEISHCFREVYGAPVSKAEAIEKVLQRLQCPPKQALLIGDAESDFKAAIKNGVHFLLRRTSLNKTLQEENQCLSFENFDAPGMAMG